MKTDILIAGSGCAGLYCALNLPKDKQITIITKSDVESNDSFLAQGGMCMLKEESDYEAFFEDTLKNGRDYDSFVAGCGKGFALIWSRVSER